MSRVNRAIDEVGRKAFDGLESSNPKVRYVTRVRADEGDALDAQYARRGW